VRRERKKRSCAQARHATSLQPVSRLVYGVSLNFACRSSFIIVFQCTRRNYYYIRTRPTRRRCARSRWCIRYITTTRVTTTTVHGFTGAHEDRGRDANDYRRTGCFTPRFEYIARRVAAFL
jgi:hypothetical protein